MKEIFTDVLGKIKEIITVIVITSVLMDILVVWAMVYTNIVEIHFWSLVLYIVFGFTLFFTMIFVFIATLVLVAVLAKRKNIYARGVLLVFLIAYLVYVARLFIGTVLSFYTEDLGIDKGTYITSIISSISLIFAVTIPLYLTERNRREAEKIAKENQEYNETLIAQNKKDNDRRALEQRLSSTIPVFQIKVNDIIEIDDDYNTEYIAFLNDEPNGNEVAIPITIKNVSDRIIRNISVKKVSAKFVNTSTGKTYAPKETLFSEIHNFSFDANGINSHEKKLGILSENDEVMLEKNSELKYHIGYSIWDENLKELMVDCNCWIKIFIEVEFEVTDIFMNIYAQTFRFVVRDKNIDHSNFDISNCRTGNESKSTLSIKKIHDILDQSKFHYEQFDDKEFI